MEKFQEDIDVEGCSEEPESEGDSDSGEGEDEDEDSDIDDDDDYDDGEALDLNLDENGRMAGTSDCGLDFNFRAIMAPLLVACKQDSSTPSGPEILSQLREDCESIFGGENSFWLPAGEAARCTLEQMAADVFAFHTRDIPPDFDLSSSGAEWWVQVRKEEAAGSSFIGFHWDKDEDLVDCSGICVHPQLSTVTYLCSAGAPTMICERTSPLHYDDHQELYDPANDFVRAFISHPVCRDQAVPSDPGGAVAALKHVAFDGRMLHSAPREFLRPEAERGCSAAGGARYTFLVNIWIDHEPIGLEPLDEEQLEKLSKLGLAFDLKSGSACKRATVAAAAPSELRPAFSSTFGPTGTEHEVTFGHLVGVEEASKQCCTLEVDLGAEKGAEGKIRPAAAPDDGEQEADDDHEQPAKRKRSPDDSTGNGRNS